MLHNDRRVLVHPDRVRVMFARMRKGLEGQHLSHLSELADLQRELVELRAELDEVLKCASLRDRNTRLN